MEVKRILVPVSLALTLALPAAASVTESDRSQSALREGRYCTTTSCGPSRAPSGSATLSFGLAVLAAGWVGRRRVADPEPS